MLGSPRRTYNAGSAWGRLPSCNFPPVTEAAIENVTPLRDVEFLAERIEQVPIDEIEPHPQNPNEGDVGEIGDSIDAVGGFYSVVFVQRSTGRILAGEHRWRALRQRGAQTAPVVYLDVDDATALRIMIADNEIPRRTSRADEHRLVALLADLAQQTPQGLLGTGFDGDALDRLIADLATSIVPPSSVGLGQDGELERRLTTDVRQIVLIMDQEEFDFAVRTLARIIDASGEEVDSNGAAVLSLLHAWDDENPAPDDDLATADANPDG